MLSKKKSENDEFKHKISFLSSKFSQRYFIWKITVDTASDFQVSCKKIVIFNGITT